MKKLILLCIIIPFVCYGQMRTVLIDAESGSVWTKPLEPEVSNFQLALSSANKLNHSTEDSVNTWCYMLKDSLSCQHGSLTLKTRFDRFWNLWLPNTQASLMDFVYNSGDSSAVAVSSPTFTPWIGWTGSSTSYINTNFTPLYSAIIYLQNSASVGIWCNANIGTGIVDIGSQNNSPSIGTGLSLLYSASNYFGAINYYSYSGGTSTTSAKFGSIIKDSASSFNIYSNGSLAFWQSCSSTGLSMYPFYINGWNLHGSLASFGSRQYALAFVGNGRTVTEASREYNCNNWLLSAEHKKGSQTWSMTLSDTVSAGTSVKLEGAGWCWIDWGDSTLSHFDQAWNPLSSSVNTVTHTYSYKGHTRNVVIYHSNNMTEFATNSASQFKFNLNTVPSSITNFQMNQTDTLITGNISYLANCTQIILAGNNHVNTYTPMTTWNNSINYFLFNPAAGYGLTSALIDSLCIDLNNCAWAGSGKTLTLQGGNASPTSASSAARTALAAKGVTIATN